ncbi:hypothetical protein FS837_000177 [Tulasnella sp. UAMH 9824]|nr:hypothetical protein FS837_000177 [Tulasnella sp. UAMH 9824]
MSPSQHSDSESSSNDREEDQDYCNDSQMEEDAGEPETPPKKAAKASNWTQSKPKPPKPANQPSTPKTSASRPTTSANNFNRFLGDQAKLVRAAHRDTIESGYRPNRGTRNEPSVPGRSKKGSKDHKESQDLPSKSKAGRKPKNEFPLRACVFLTQGVDAYDGTAGPDLGKCYEMQKWGLAVVADTESDLAIDKTASEANMENFLRKLFPQVFDYFDDVIASAGSTRRQEQKAAGKSWELRITYFTGPSKIPNEQLKLWGVPESWRAELNDDSAESGEDSGTEGAGEPDLPSDSRPEMGSTGNKENDRVSTAPSSNRTPALRTASSSSKGKRKARSPSPTPSFDNEPGPSTRVASTTPCPYLRHLELMVFNKLNSLKAQLERLPASLPNPPAQQSSYQWQLDQDFLSDEGIVAATNQMLEQVMGMRANGITIRERGQSISGVVEVLCLALQVIPT